MSSPFTLKSNGYLYPSRQLTEAEHQRLVDLVHHLACGKGMSIQQVRKHLVDYGIWRSVGAISQYLSRFECDRCASSVPVSAAAPATSTRPEVFSWTS